MNSFAEIEFKAFVMVMERRTQLACAILRSGVAMNRSDEIAKAARDIDQAISTQAHQDVKIDPGGDQS